MLSYLMKTFGIALVLALSGCAALTELMDPPVKAPETVSGKTYQEIRLVGEAEVVRGCYQVERSAWVMPRSCATLESAFNGGETIPSSTRDNLVSMCERDIRAESAEADTWMRQALFDRKAMEAMDACKEEERQRERELERKAEEQRQAERAQKAARQNELENKRVDEYLNSSQVFALLKGADVEPYPIMFENGQHLGGFNPASLFVCYERQFSPADVSVDRSGSDLTVDFQGSKFPNGAMNNSYKFSQVGSAWVIRELSVASYTITRAVDMNEYLLSMISNMDCSF